MRCVIDINQRNISPAAFPRQFHRFACERAKTPGQARYWNRFGLRSMRARTCKSCT